MICCNLLLFLSIISINLGSIHALNAEHVFGGLTASQRNFQYHVTVSGKRNKSDSIFILCSGALIREDLLLSVAHCFLNSEGQLREVSFLITAGTNNVSSSQGVNIWISEIYMPRLQNTLQPIDISISKMRDSLSFEPDSLFSKLKQPILDNLYDKMAGFLAGCECLEVLNDLSLKFIQVEFLKESVWKNIVPALYETMQGAGLKIARLMHDNFDLCETDAGSPLVVGKTVVGIAIKVLLRNTPFGKLMLYTDVYRLRNFINSILENHLDPEQIVLFYNNVHVL